MRGECYTLPIMGAIRHSPRDCVGGGRQLNGALPQRCTGALAAPALPAMTKGHDMPSFTPPRRDIYYEEFATASHPDIAPAGLQSTIAVWSRPSAPVNPPPEFATDFRVMRWISATRAGVPCAHHRAGRLATLTAADHIALLDHLGIDQCHLYGSASVDPSSSAC